MRPEPVVLVQLVRTGMMNLVTSVAETGVFLLSTIARGLIAPQALPAHAIVFRSLGGSVKPPPDDMDHAIADGG
jgi:hypothetical protein